MCDSKLHPAASPLLPHGQATAVHAMMHVRLGGRIRRLLFNVWRLSRSSSCTAATPLVVILIAVASQLFNASGGLAADQRLWRPRNCSMMLAASPPLQLTFNDVGGLAAVTTYIQ
jgi:hypothetical protein